jgi:hypothetical protein
MRIYKSKWFVKFCRKERIGDDKLREAVRRIETGSVDCYYGDGLVKQRISRANEGKSGGYRSIIIFRKGMRSFFVYGFPKNTRDNIDKGDVRDFKQLATVLLGASEEELMALVKSGKYEEVIPDGKD